MSTRVVDQVDSWDNRSFSGGYRELQDLADGEFSGVIRAGGAELYMTRGVVVGIRRGDIEDFQSGGTVYQSPTDALPLLAIMQERSEEVRAKYYTEDTTISKVDKTLSDGGFTGFIELSENVLSGDYYLVYHAGTSMSVAYVGESSRLIKGDEAFETADGEVGIYEVRPVDIDPIEIPEPEDNSADSAAGSTAPAETDTEPTTDETAASPSEEPTETADPSEQPAQTAEPSPDRAAASATRGAQSERETKTEGSSDEREEPRSQSEQSSTTAAESEPRQSAQSAESGATERTGSQTTESETQSRQRRSDSQSREQATRGGATGAGATGRTRNEQQSSDSRGRPQSPQEPARSEQRDQEASRGQRDPGAAANGDAKAIPSLDPGMTAVPDDDSDEPIPSPQAQSPQSQSAQPEPEPEPETRRAEKQEPEPVTEAPPPEPEPEGEPAAAPPAEPEPAATPAVDTEQIEELETELEEKAEEIDRLESELDSVTEERDELETELEQLRGERDELQSEVEELQSDFQQLEEELGAATDAERRLTPDEALAGTDIFVRYRSKGKATLEKAHGASTRKDEVNENLRLEKHTQFDAATVAVGGQSYDEFLESTLEYQFVQWVVRELLFEVRDTGHAKALGDLYGVLPRIDRAELSGVVEITYTEDGQETQAQEAFDVVLRDRMGNPLLAANLNDTREATTESMMERLITSAERVGQSAEGFSGAFLVTESFFDPGALEIASDATQGGLLSRDKRKSFVNLSRKQGYHLCLVEARNENFHLAVPEL